MLAILIGAGAGFASILFRRMIELVQHVAQDGLGELLRPGLGIVAIVPLVALGGLLVGLVTKFFSPEAKGHGVSEVMFAVAHAGGRIRPRVAIFKMISAALTIGSGGSAGREGPIVQIGAAWGSSVAQWLRLPDRQIILALACGAAGGMAATFNAPMAGVIFALEVILSRFTALSFGLVVMSSATATVVARAMSVEGDAPAIHLAQEYALHGIPELAFFLLLGLLSAFVAWAYSRALYGVEDLSEHVKLPDYVKPAAGGLLVGIAAIWVPGVMGSDYAPIEAALNNQTAMGTLFLLCAAKIICTALTLGSGGSGGTFAPALFIGAMFGGGYGNLLNSWFPGFVTSPGAYALVGMAAVFAGSAHAPITAIFMLFEMTDDYRIIIPLMSATVVATLVSQRLSVHSIYTLKLSRRGIEWNRAREINVMDAVTVGEAMDEAVEAVPPNMPINDLIDKLNRRHETGYPVLDLDGRLVGIVTQRDVEEALVGGRDIRATTVGDICTRNVVVCRPDQTLNTVLAQFGAHSFGRMPVIDPERPERIIGILDRRRIIEAYAEACQRAEEMLTQADTLEKVRNEGDMVLVQDVVGAGSRLAHMFVRDATFPPEASLGAIRRAQATLVPRGSTQILPGDRLVLLTTREHVDTVRSWLEEAT